MPLQVQIKLCQDIAERERLSRKEAERLLEVKALELYEKKQNIERAKAEVEALNRLLLNVMESSPDGIVTCSEDMTIQAVNVTAERQLGYSQTEIEGRSIEVILPDFIDLLGTTDETAFKFDKLHAVNAQGDGFPVEVRGTRDGKDRQTYYVLFIHDVSKEVQAQKELKLREHQIDEARRLEAIGALAAGIAHEINTPIQFIGDNLGFLREAIEKIYKSYQKYEALRQEAAKRESLVQLSDDILAFNQDIQLTAMVADIYDCVEESVGGIEQVRDIVLLMKEFAHPGTGGEELTDINDIIGGVVKIAHNKYRGIASVKMDLCDELPKIECRRGQIQQVILNIVMNAVDAIEDSGKTPGTIGLSTLFDEHSVHIRISDTGAGVPQSLKEKIFDPFFTTKPVGKGTGQGLALAKDFIITGHDGQLQFVDIEGFATTFQISLPRHRAINKTMETQDAA